LKFSGRLEVARSALEAGPLERPVGHLPRIDACFNFAFEPLDEALNLGECSKKLLSSNVQRGWNEPRLLTFINVCKQSGFPFVNEEWVTQFFKVCVVVLSAMTGY